MRRASLAAVNAPKVIKTDKLRSYAPAIDEIFPFAKPVKSEGLRAEINNNRSERRQGSYRARIKTLRGLDSPESGQHYRDGWTLACNHFRDHEGAGGEPPAVRAKVKLPYTEWADGVRGGAADPAERIRHKRISAIEEPAFRVSLKPGATLPGAPQPRRRERRAARKSASGYTPTKVNVGLPGP